MAISKTKEVSNPPGPQQQLQVPVHGRAIFLHHSEEESKPL